MKTISWPRFLGLLGIPTLIAWLGVWALYGKNSLVGSAAIGLAVIVLFAVVLPRFRSGQRASPQSPEMLQRRLALKIGPVIDFLHDEPMGRGDRNQLTISAACRIFDEVGRTMGTQDSAKIAEVIVRARELPKLPD